MHSEGAPDHLPGSLVPDRLEALFDNKIWIGYNLPVKYLVVAYLYFTRWVRLFEVWLVLFIKKIRPQPDFFRFFLRGYRLKYFSLNETAPFTFREWKRRKECGIVIKS